jgi:Na+/H+ antiporter NhaD/arsenite permease-like protein
MFGAAILFLLDNLGKSTEKTSEIMHDAFGQVEWITLFFFIGLFIVVAGVEHVGFLDLVADAITNYSDHAATVAIMVMWVSAIVSALVDNIPFVATMIPVIEELLPRLQEEADSAASMAIWWSLALGACLGGNGSLIGASANLIVAGYAEREGHPIRFLKFLRHGFPLMLMSVAIANVYIWLRYLT